MRVNSGQLVSLLIVSGFDSCELRELMFGLVWTGSIHCDGSLATRCRQSRSDAMDAHNVLERGLQTRVEA